jgi:flagellar protein FlbT
MMMYLDEDANDRHYTDFALRMTEFLGAIRDKVARAACIEISREVQNGAYYKALMLCRKLFEFEKERLGYDA